MLRLKNSTMGMNALSSDVREAMVSETHPTALRVILSSVSSDSHTWNLVYLQLLLEEMGHEVINLGACTPDGLIIEACERQTPDLLVISSVNGHGHIDGSRMIRALRAQAELQGLPAVIGGKLGVKGLDNTAHTEKLLEAGFSAVFDASENLQRFGHYVSQLSHDKHRREQARQTMTRRHFRVPLMEQYEGLAAV